MKFSIIVCTLNRPDLLNQCCKALQKQNFKDFEVIIVDQSDEPVGNSLDYDGLRIQYVHTPLRGLSRSRNVGIRKSNGEYICILDDDAEYDENFLNNVFQLTLAEGSNVDIFCGKVIDKFTKQVFSKGMINGDFQIDINNLMESCVSTSLVIRRSILDEIGYFDELFGVGAVFGAGEESDFLLRALYKNKIIRYFSDLVVFHPEPNRITNKSALKKIYSYGIGQGALDAKHYYEYKNVQMFNKDRIMLVRTFLGAFKHMFISVNKSKSRLLYVQGAIKGFYMYKSKLREKRNENSDRC